MTKGVGEVEDRILCAYEKVKISSNTDHLPAYSFNQTAQCCLTGLVRLQCLGSSV